MALQEEPSSTFLVVPAESLCQSHIKFNTGSSLEADSLISGYKHKRYAGGRLPLSMINN